ncbi:caspase domain-containing protein [Cyathus striatus]|nr:caspase domain-containing protein [Cyathus striatus]
MPGSVGHSNSYGPLMTVHQPPIQTTTHIHNNSQYPSFPSPVPIQPSHSYSSQPQTLNAKPSGLDPTFQYSKCTGRKKALCIGINYLGQANELRGCINDAKHVREFLIRFKSGDIVLLTDDSTNPRQFPTKKNILDAMRWLVRSARTNDSLFFHYSGHGGQVQDQDGDEVDGFDEVIYPQDFKTNGHIVDDVKPLPRGCRLTSCHSGTVLGKPLFVTWASRRHVSDRSRRAKETGADAISWSGCKDGQTSADTFADGVAVGAMSHDRPNQSYQDLLQAVRRILYAKYSQKPQLGSSHPIVSDLYQSCLPVADVDLIVEQDTSLKFII